MRALVTGGAGFIGSHLSEALFRMGHDLVILDNLSSGSKQNISYLVNKHKGIELFMGDCTKIEDIKRALRDVDIVFHLAANPEVRLELNDPHTCFQQNVYATYILLEEFRKSKAHTIVFSSTSTVYGDARVLPTPEDYAPLEPISLYGASKLASEALISSYAHTYNKKAVILRLANIIGPRSKHGVIIDFIDKLKKNSRELEIFGDGNQTKSYLYKDDCIDAILKAYDLSERRVEVFNVGSEDQITVKRIAEILCEEMDLKDVDFDFTGGVDGGRGWVGDVKKMLLDVSKLRSRGWKPRYNSEEAIRLTVGSILKNRPI
ncbi:MAG: NAD-dependent epimerase/dehydratase family protein [archaeon]|nr:NAD-dependent epimerase/dehydratase family protein [archaeon]